MRKWATSTRKPITRHDDRDQQHGALDLVEVAIADVAEQHLADAGQVEHALDDDDAGQQGGQLDTDDRDHGDRGVAQAVGEQRLDPRQTLGSGRAHVVLVEDVEGRRPNEAQQDRPLGRGERQRRQDERPGRSTEVVPSLSGEALRGQSPVAGEQGDQDHRHEELRHRDAQLTDRRETHPVGLGAAHRRIHAEWYGEGEGEDRRGDDQRRGDRQLLTELAGDRRAGQGRGAEVARQYAAHPLEVLREQRAVEAQVGADLGEALRGHLGAGDDDSEVPGTRRSREKTMTVANSRAIANRPSRRTRNQATRCS